MTSSGGMFGISSVSFCNARFIVWCVCVVIVGLWLVVVFTVWSFVFIVTLFLLIVRCWQLFLTLIVAASMVMVVGFVVVPVVFSACATACR